MLSCQTELLARNTPTGIFARDNISEHRRNELTAKLRKITGLRGLDFTQTGFLELGNTDSNGGSKIARTLVSSLLVGSDLVVLEDASNRPDVIFSSVTRGEWRSDPQSEVSAYIVLIDFADFEHVIGDRRALSAFDLGWVLLHELDHIVNDSGDPEGPGEAGDCESHINLMRQECNLPTREEYFVTFLPQSKDSVFKRRFVRLAFTEWDSSTRKTRRYWVMWDASLVGGLDDLKQIANVTNN
ncbi:MAG TPA: hypothetical protein VMM84_08805 [Pyrinomonadaceae bacterium]|nr:hypothetical protein [Pyrinomonadaceae bacterium]